MTERDMVLRERAAFTAGWHAAQDPHTDWRCDVEILKRYPLPTITRPRVMRDEHGYAWAIFEGKLNHASDPGGNFVESECVRPTPTRIKIWADLLANPNETVDQ